MLLMEDAVMNMDATCFYHRELSPLLHAFGVKHRIPVYKLSPTWPFTNLKSKHSVEGTPCILKTCMVSKGKQMCKQTVRTKRKHRTCRAGNVG